MRRHRRRVGGHGDEEVPWPSFADALTGLLFVFIVLALSFAYQLSKAKIEADERAQELALQGQQRQRAQEVERDLIAVEGSGGEKAHSVAICLRDLFPEIELSPTIRESRLSIYLVEDGRSAGTVGWFDTGKAALNAKSCAVAQALGPCLEEALAHPRLGSENDDRFLLRVFVEGHTDNERVVGGDFATNWELSAARASAVVRAFLVSGAESGRELPCQAKETPARLKREMARQRLDVVATGMAERRPAWGRVCEEAPDDSVCRCFAGEGAALEQCETELRSDARWRDRLSAAKNACASLVGRSTRASDAACACLRLDGKPLIDCGDSHDVDKQPFLKRLEPAERYGVEYYTAEQQSTAMRLAIQSVCARRAEAVSLSDDPTSACACRDHWGPALDACIEGHLPDQSQAPHWQTAPLTDLFVTWANSDVRPAGDSTSGEATTPRDRRELQRRVDLRFEVVPGTNAALPDARGYTQ